MRMTPKLRTIRTGRRSPSVKRSDVASAVKAVIAKREMETGRFDIRESDPKTARSRKQ